MEEVMEEEIMAAAQQILELFCQGETWDYVEMCSVLDLDLDLIVATCRELEDAGKLAAVDDSPHGEGYYPGAFVYHGSWARVGSDCSQRTY